VILFYRLFELKISGAILDLNLYVWPCIFPENNSSPHKEGWGGGVGEYFPILDPKLYQDSIFQHLIFKNFLGEELAPRPT